MVGGNTTDAVAEAVNVDGVSKVLFSNNVVSCCLSLYDTAHMSPNYPFLLPLPHDDTTILTCLSSLSPQSLEHNLAENLATVVQSLSADYTHILTPSSNVGKNFMPRLGAMMDSAPLSDVMEVRVISYEKR